MVDLHYADARLAAIYDLESGWSEDRDFYLSLAGASPISVLDLGCGTGLLTAAFARAGHRVTGVDPSPAMLVVARQRKDGSLVRWVEATAETFRDAGRFDLVVMTGNAFQVLLDEAQALAVLQTMALHLAPNGRVVFETRNPALDWAARWNKEQHWTTDQGPVLIRRCVRQRQGDMIDFTQEFVVSGESLTSESRLRFWQPIQIERLANAAGLRLTGLWGDWAGLDFDPTQSEEMVVELRAA
ncbi:class I SAM-dependent methyltransferase [Neogemmobacter tilapiae]|uniref:Methyltransferase n=1 Tax=Neogemmobacter tilapiae TaxID=875041 RepID=A0A918TUP9_9RHOB|nr:class I SAM-dependent methyltransferase [Gemmobacter tilapiae]GHC57446.1 methyltransferase [Gemmobacter tilapiae]